jgi:hypothetical protein
LDGPVSRGLVFVNLARWFLYHSRPFAIDKAALSAPWQTRLIMIGPGALPSSVLVFWEAAWLDRSVGFGHDQFS